MGSANMGWRRSSTPCRSLPSLGAAPGCQGRRHQPPPVLQAWVHPKSHGPPAPTSGCSTHSSTRLPREGLGVLRQPPQRARACASRVHPSRAPQGTQPAPAPPADPCSLPGIFCLRKPAHPLAPILHIPHPHRCTLQGGHEPAAQPGRCQGCSWGRPPPCPLRAAPDQYPEDRGLSGPTGTSSEHNTHSGTVHVPAGRGDPPGGLRWHSRALPAGPSAK